MRSIFNSSKSILKAWEAFSILRKAFSKAWEAFSILRKAFSKREKHFQFFENHFQSVRGIHKNLWKGILKSEKAFSTLDEAFEKKRNISIQVCISLNFYKIISNLDKKKACPKKGITNIPWRHSENAHRFGQRRHDFLSKASRVQLEKLKQKKKIFSGQAKIMIYMFQRRTNGRINSSKKLVW